MIPSAFLKVCNHMRALWSVHNVKCLASIRIVWRICGFFLSRFGFQFFLLVPRPKIERGEVFGSSHEIKTFADTRRGNSFFFSVITADVAQAETEGRNILFSRKLSLSMQNLDMWGVSCIYLTVGGFASQDENDGFFGRERPNLIWCSFMFLRKPTYLLYLSVH